jgi:pimeloyl-ACP methyl ester carboxylesterase
LADTVNDYREQTVDCGQIKMNYASWPGDGPPLLLVHGLSGRWQSWLNVVPLLRTRWRIFAVDLRGHGKSGRSVDGYPLKGYAADVEKFIETVIGGPVSVVGHSLGGMTAIVIAATAPGLVRSAVLEDPPIYVYRRPQTGQRFLLTHEMANSRLSVEEIAQRILRERPENTPEQATMTAQSWRALDPRTVGGVIDRTHMWGDGIEEHMRRTRCPTLLLQANADLGGAMSDADGARASEVIPDCTLVRWPDSNHSMHLSKPAEFVAAIEAHFKRA